MINQKTDHPVSTNNNKSDDDLERKKSDSDKKLYRNTNDNIFGGVCSGLADYFGKSVIIIRIVFFILTLFFFIGIIVYTGLWIGMSNKKNIDSDLNLDSIPNKSYPILKLFKNSFLLIAFIMLGCFIGFAAGGLSGPTGNGGVSNFTGAVIGTFLGVIIWINILSKKKN
ncbi:MAG: PspC domain-containing protein [Cyclobacteriaceae bacterium]